MDRTEYSTIRKAYKSMQDLVFETLRDQILTGKLKPGESLNTLALSKRLDVSRTPIREALNRLVSIGLAENIPYKGAIVRKLSVDEIIEIYYIRAALAGICARLAAAKLNDAQKQRLSILCDEMESLQASLNHNLMLKKNFEFHQIIIKAANSPKIEELTLQYYHQSEAYRALALELPGRYAQVCKEHREILTALLQGNRERAEQTSREHQLNTARVIAKSLGVDIDL